MDKLTAVRVKYDDGTYSNQIPINVLAENVNWDSQLVLKDILGAVEFDKKGSIQGQIDELSAGKVDLNELNNYISSYINNNLEDWLDKNRPQINIDNTLKVAGAAADAAATGTKIAEIEDQLDNVSINKNDLGLTQDSSTGYVYPTYKGEPSTNGIQIAGGGGGQGITIDSTSIQYVASSDGVNAPSSGWSNNIPSTTPGQYLWTKTYVQYSDGTHTEAYSVSRNGTNGTNGKNGTAGQNGRSVQSVIPYYYKSTSNTAQVGGSWTATRPEWEQGKYIWTKIVTTYSDNSTVQTNPYLLDDNNIISYVDGKDSDLQNDITNIQGQVTTAQSDITTIQSNIEGISVKNDKIVYDASLDKTGKYISTDLPLFSNKGIVCDNGLQLYTTAGGDRPYIDFHYGPRTNFEPINVDNPKHDYDTRLWYQLGQDRLHLESNFVMQYNLAPKWTVDSEDETIQHYVDEGRWPLNVGRLLYNLGQTKQGNVTTDLAYVRAGEWVSLANVWLPIGIYLVFYSVLVGKDQGRSGNPYLTARLIENPISETGSPLDGLHGYARSSLYVPDNSQYFTCSGMCTVVVTPREIETTGGNKTTQNSRNITLEVWTSSNLGGLAGAELRATALWCQSDHFVYPPQVLDLERLDPKILRTRVGSDDSIWT